MTRGLNSEIQPDTLWWRVGESGEPEVVRVVDVYRRTGLVTFRTFDGALNGDYLDADGARWIAQAVPPRWRRGTP